MTGLAATLGAESPATAIAIADALVVRGPDLASWQAGGANLLIRAAMPAVHALPAGALLLDGDAAPSALAAAYASGGRRGLLTGRHPYAVVLADLSRNALLLARNGDGPPLYWARLGRAVLVASEPAALLAGGVPADPDPVVIERFLATGGCDDTPATFFAHVRRVLPGQVVEVTLAGSRSRDPDGSGGTVIRIQEPPVAPPVTATAALATADLNGRMGVRLGCGIGAAAVLGAALAKVERPRPLLVYSTTFPELATADSSAYCAAALLGPYALGSARHRALPFFADEIDIDSYLADVGEPTPDLDDWLRWAIARRVSGEVDALADAGAGAHLSRLADRLATRFGVGLRAPLRDVPEPARAAELVPVVQRSLPSSAAGFAVAVSADRGTDALLAGLLRRMRAELVATFLRPRGTAGGLADTLALVSGERIDVRSLWRRYVVERWLRGVDGKQEPAGRATAHASTQDERRVPVRTEVFAAGDKIPEKFAWYAGETVAKLDPVAPWYVLLAAKPVAVMQGRARYLWDIHPGPTARLLHRLARSGGGPGTPWAMQVAIEEGGRWRLAMAATGAAVGHLVDRALPGGTAGERRFDWYARIAGPLVRAIREPREDAPTPGTVAVIPAPSDPDGVAADVVAALRTVTPDSSYRLLGGCAVLSAAGDLLGWAPGADSDPVAGDLIAGSLPAGGFPADQLLAGDLLGCDHFAADPFGDGLTPVVVAVPDAASQRPVELHSR